jgi:hypothetical protein
MVDEVVAQGRVVRRAHVEFEDAAAAWSEGVSQNAGRGSPVDTRLDCDSDATVARAHEEVRVDLPAVGLRRGEARDPFGGLIGERVEHRRRTEERQAQGVGSGGRGARDDAVILPRQGSHAQTSQFIDRRRSPLWISRGVSNQQFEWSPHDPAGVVDLANGQLQPSEQVSAGRDPARPSERHERADLDG